MIVVCVVVELEDGEVEGTDAIEEGGSSGEWRRVGVRSVVTGLRVGGVFRGRVVETGGDDDGADHEVEEEEEGGRGEPAGQQSPNGGGGSSQSRRIRHL